MSKIAKQKTLEKRTDVLLGDIITIQEALGLLGRTAKNIVLMVGRIDDRIKERDEESKNLIDSVLQDTQEQFDALLKRVDMGPKLEELAERIEDLLARAVTEISQAQHSVVSVNRIAQRNTDRVDELATSVALLVEELQAIRKERLECPKN
jgi:hypothetical protein